MDGRYSDGRPRGIGVIQPDFATEDDYEWIRERLTSGEAIAVLDAYVRQEQESRATGRGRWFTRKDIGELMALCEAEGNCIIYNREVAKLRDLKLPIPCMVNLKASSADAERLREAGIELEEGGSIQAWGVGGMAKRSAEEARLSRNALGLNKQARARIMDEVRQGDLFEEMSRQAEQDASSSDSENNNVVKLHSVRERLDKLIADGLVAG